MGMNSGSLYGGNDTPKSDGFTVTEVDLGVRNVVLTSGENIIGRVWYDANKHNYTIEKPVAPRVSQAQANQVNIGFGPLRPWSRDTERLSIKEEHVAYTIGVDEGLAKAYHEATSNIVLPDATDLTSLLAGK